jgi:hypothetical protein
MKDPWVHCFREYIEGQGEEWPSGPWRDCILKFQTERMVELWKSWRLSMKPAQSHTV